MNQIDPAAPNGEDVQFLHQRRGHDAGVSQKVSKGSDSVVILKDNYYHLDSQTVPWT